jgi:hypothetical protein
LAIPARGTSTRGSHFHLEDDASHGNEQFVVEAPTFWTASAKSRAKRARLSLWAQDVLRLKLWDESAPPIA